MPCLFIVGRRYTNLLLITTAAGALINLVLSIAKIFGGVAYNSKALLADGVHSLSDLVSDIGSIPEWLRFLLCSFGVAMPAFAMCSQNFPGKRVGMGPCVSSVWWRFRVLLVSFHLGEIFATAASSFWVPISKRWGVLHPCRAQYANCVLAVLEASSKAPMYRRLWERAS